MLDASDERAADIAQACESAYGDMEMLVEEHGTDALAVYLANVQMWAANEFDIEIELVADPQSLN